MALTPKGEALAEELIRAARQHEINVLARYPEMDSVRLKALLRSVLERETKPYPA